MSPDATSTWPQTQPRNAALLTKEGSLISTRTAATEAPQASTPSWRCRNAAGTDRGADGDRDCSKCPHRGFAVPNVTGEVPGTPCPIPGVQRAQRWPGIRRQHRRTPRGRGKVPAQEMGRTLNWGHSHSPGMVPHKVPECPDSCSKESAGSAPAGTQGQH